MGTCLPRLQPIFIPAILIAMMGLLSACTGPPPPGYLDHVDWVEVDNATGSTDVAPCTPFFDSSGRQVEIWGAVRPRGHYKVVFQVRLLRKGQRKPVESWSFSRGPKGPYHFDCTTEGPVPTGTYRVAVRSKQAADWQVNVTLLHPPDESHSPASISGRQRVAVALALGHASASWTRPTR